MFLPLIPRCLNTLGCKFSIDGLVEHLTDKVKPKTVLQAETYTLTEETWRSVRLSLNKQTVANSIGFYLGPAKTSTFYTKSTIKFKEDFV